MPKTRPPYPAEFRANAVRLLRSSGKTIPELARELGCSTETLRNWTKQIDLDTGRRTDDDLAAVAAALNSRPRKTLRWKTPAEVFNHHLISLQQGNVATAP